MHPKGRDVVEFAEARIWEVIYNDPPPTRINARSEFITFLRNKGCPAIVCEEYAERNLSLVLTTIAERCGEWDLLGIPRPLHIVDQVGSILTWAHPNYQHVSGRTPPPNGFVKILDWVRSLQHRDFLFPCAAYLYCMGCTKIFITDTTGDGGADLIGTASGYPLRGLLFIVQSKSSLGNVSKESLFADFAKFYLLSRHPKWTTYLDALRLNTAIDGFNSIFVFASNAEFVSGIQTAARELPIILRSGRQIAHCMATKNRLEKWIEARDEFGDMESDLNRNLATVFREHVG